MVSGWTVVRRSMLMPGYGKIKVCVRIRFVVKGEVPPFGVKREKPMTQHSIAQDETVRLLLGGVWSVFFGLLHTHRAQSKSVIAKERVRIGG